MLSCLTNYLLEQIDYPNQGFLFVFIALTQDLLIIIALYKYCF